MSKRKPRTKRKQQRPKQTISLPVETWAEDFRQYAFRTNFMLTLSQAMIEFLCATADDVVWDRTRYSHNLKPDNFLASGRALEKRGLVKRIPRDERLKNSTGDFWVDVGAYHVMTPAGEKVVELLKVTGCFVEADGAIIKKAH